MSPISAVLALSTHTTLGYIEAGWAGQGQWSTARHLAEVPARMRGLGRTGVETAVRRGPGQGGGAGGHACLLRVTTKIKIDPG